MSEQSSYIPSDAPLSFFAGSTDITMTNPSFNTIVNNIVLSSTQSPPRGPVSGFVLSPDHNRMRVPTPPQAPLPEWSEIFHRQTPKFKMGFALLDPRPDQTVPVRSYQREGLGIGDVGMITAGHGNFHYYFNMSLRSTHEKNRGRTPREFQPFELSLFDTRATNTPVSSNLLTSVKLDLDRNVVETCDELKFSGSSTDCPEGVIIFVGDGFEGKAMEATTEQRARQWIHANAYGWYRHLMSRPNSIVNGDLRVIIGYEKTTYWARATFAGVGSNTTNDFSMRLRLFDHPPRDPRFRCMWDHSGAVWPHTSFGPDEGEGAVGERLLKNQAVFVKAITVTLGDDEWARLEAELAAAVYVAEAPSQTGSGTQTSSHSSSSPKQSGWRSRIPRIFRTGKSVSGQHSRPSASLPSEVQSDSSDSSRDYYDWGSDSDTLYGDRFNFEERTYAEVGCDETKWRGIENHPCSLLNKALLERAPHAKTAVTSDNDWMRVLTEDDEVRPSAAELATRTIQTHDIVVEDYMVSVKPRESSHSQSGSVCCSGPDSRLFSSILKADHKLRGLPRDKCDVICFENMVWFSDYY